MDGLVRNWLEDPAFERIAERDLIDGQHRTPSEHPGWFTTAFFTHPDELAGEARAAGLDLRALVEAEPSLLGVSPHLLAIARC